MFMMVIAHAHERCFLLQEELDFRLYEAVLLFTGTQQQAISLQIGSKFSAKTNARANQNRCRQPLNNQNTMPKYKLLNNHSQPNQQLQLQQMKSGIIT